MKKCKTVKVSSRGMTKRFLLTELGCIFLVLCATVLFTVMPKGNSVEEVKPGVKYDNDRTTLGKAFGSLFGVTDEGFSQDPQSRPEENDEIPFSSTHLYHAFDYFDKYNLYIKCRQFTLSDTGYTQFDSEYAVKGTKIYIHIEADGVPLYYLSDGERLLGLDFEEKTYTVLSPAAYTPEELLYIGDFTFCSSAGKDLFLGNELDYEDYTLDAGAWIRYYFNTDGVLAGYVRYNKDGEIEELTEYEVFTSEIPEDAVLHFSIPAGFEQYTDIIEWSDILGDNY